MAGIKRILPIFSYIFHPLFVPLYAVVYAILLDQHFLLPAEKYLLLIQVGIITVLIPICFYFLLRSLGRIDSVMAEDVKQRKAPLLVHIILIYLLLRQSITLERMPELYFFFLGAMFSAMTALLAAFRMWRISLHMMAMAGLIFFVIGIAFHNRLHLADTIAFLFVSTGFVASSRLYMKAHDYLELVLGFFAGMLPQIALWYFWV